VSAFDSEATRPLTVICSKVKKATKMDHIPIYSVLTPSPGVRLVKQLHSKEVGTLCGC
jgi:hypothetical protein